ncbi:MAG: choice-of-anchor Q domain-containing protein [Actinomycetota bacterium]
MSIRTGIRAGVVILLALAVVPAVAPEHASAATAVDCTANPAALQPAIDAAAAGETLAVTGDCVAAFAVYGQGFVIDKELTLQGDGSTKLHAFGNNFGVVLEVPPGVGNVHLNDLTLVDGDWDDSSRAAGLTIYAGADVTLTRVTVTDNFGTGGIANAGHLTLNDSTVSANSAGDYGEPRGCGGGIRNGGTLTLNDSTVSGNHASGTSGDGGAVGQGGGICNLGTLTITRSTVSQNSVSGSGTPRSDKAAGGGIANLAGTATITDSIVSENGAGTDHDASGGGISNKATLTITDSTIDGNTARAGGLDPLGAKGGGISNDGGDLTLIRSTVSGNAATLIPSANPVLAWGGGIWNGTRLEVIDLELTSFPGTITMTDSTVGGNTARTEGELDTSVDVRGGGVVNGDSASLVVTNSTVSGNSVEAQAPGQFGNAFGQGGGMELVAGTASLINTTISDNAVAASAGMSATTVAGGIHIGTASVSMDAAILAGNDGSSEPDCAGSVTADYSLVEDPSGCTVTGANNMTGVDPLLGALQGNGGPTPTMLPDAASPVVNAIPTGSCPEPADQRGLPRPKGSGCDIGATEFARGFFARLCTIRGTSGGDDITGTEGDDYICGFAGGDTIDGEGGHDIINGGPGPDTVTVGIDDDTVYGGAGNDLLISTGGNDLLKGGYGRDNLNAVDGVDGNATLDGGRGADICQADPGDVLLSC